MIFFRVSTEKTIYRGVCGGSASEQDIYCVCQQDGDTISQTCGAGLDSGGCDNAFSCKL